MNVVINELLAPLAVLWVVFMAVVALAIYLMLGGAGKRMRRVREEISPRFLRGTVSSLLPWSPQHGLADLSSLCRGQAEMSALGGTTYHARGTMQSQSQSAMAWLAYTVNIRRRQGTVILHTSANELVAEVDTERDRTATVRVDGRPFGTVRMRTGEMADLLGRPVGRLSRGKAVTIYGMTNYRDVELNGRRVAEINGNLLHLGQRLGPSPPAFRLHDADLSCEEVWWLLALLALELYFDRNRLLI